MDERPAKPTYNELVSVVAELRSANVQLRSINVEFHARVVELHAHVELLQRRDLIETVQHLVQSHLAGRPTDLRTSTSG